MSCKKCKDTGIDPHVSECDGFWIEGYCACKAGDKLAEKMMCFDCGEIKEDCICGKTEPHP